MYEDLTNKLRELPHLLFVQLGEHEDVVYQAADAIEKLDMKLQGANAAIAGMQREIERMVIDSVNSKPQWIPVTERLAYSGLFLVACNEWGGSAVRKAAYDEATGKWFEPRSNGMKNITNIVTHWMPLPEPPKEETCQT